MANPTLRFKRGSQSSFGSVGLQTGEPSFITDESNFYIGFDGTNGNNKFFGSSRYWKKETTTIGGGVNLYGSHAVGVGGTAITLAAPNSVGTAVTFTFPATQGAVSSVLTNDGSGILSWSSGSVNPVFTGIATFTGTTDNTLGNADTGAVQIDGGLGINKNLTVGANLNVQGYSEFVGVVTFKGGTIVLGDGNTDNINVGGEFISNLTPNTNNTYDIGISTQKWRDAYFSGIGSFGGDIVVDGGDVITSATTFNLVNTTATNVNLAGAATALNLGATTGIATINNPTLVGTQATQNLYNTVATTVNAFGASTSLNLGATTGTATISNATLTLPNATTVNVNGANPTLASSSTGTLTEFNTNITTVNAYGQATTIGIGSTAATLTLRPSTVVGTNASQNLYNTVATTVNAFGAATALNLGAATGTATISNPTLTLANATTVNVNGANPTLASSSSGTLTAFNTNITRVDAFQAATDVVLSSTSGITTIRNNLTVGGDIQVTGNDIKSSTGAIAITLADNDVTIADDLTVTGNLYVNGSTTQVNTTALTVEDRTIDLGIVNGAAPATNTTWDLGILFNYYSAAAAKKSAVVWEHADARFKFASVLGADTNGSDVNTPQLTVTTFAPIEIGELWINSACTGGTQQVIGCSGGELQLQNIVIDGGVF